MSVPTATPGPHCALPTDESRLRDAVRTRLSDWEPRTVEVLDDARRAAVAITLYAHRGQQHVLMIKRVRRGTNPGHWALPGGRLDAGEDAVAAATRELEEETGLHARDEDVLGCLDDFATLTGYTITPVVVALAGHRRPRRSPAEVASLHPIPLSRLADPDLARWRTTPHGPPLLQLPLRHDMVVHAPTGAILWQFAEVCLRGRPTRVHDLAQPSWTGR